MLAVRGFTPKYGARQIAVNIRTYPRRPILRLIVGEKLDCGQKPVIEKHENDELTWNII